MDYLLYISANQSACPPIVPNAAQTVAFAGFCETELSQDRPVAGYINFCPAGVENRDPEFAFALSKHEIMHALAFSRDLFALWRDPADNSPRTQRNGLTGLPNIGSDG